MRKRPQRKRVSDVAYEPYATAEYYHDVYLGSLVPADEIIKALRHASRHIDSLTYNRIVGQGFSNLTEFQRDIIREVVCQQADFEYDNAEIIDTILSGYSLNGASIQFGQSWNVFTDKGVAMKKDVYSLLSQSGLCCRLGVGR